MSRVRADYLEPRPHPLPTPEDLGLTQQAADSFVLDRAKELLSELWKQGRIRAEVRFTGESILSAALHAVENPGVRNVGTEQGAKLAHIQWAREERRRNEPF